MAKHTLTAILPCNDLDASEAFYAKLGFRREGGKDDYRIMFDGNGADLHLTNAVEGWLIRGRNPFGLYLYAENVDELAAALGGLVLHKPRDCPWGMYEFALSDPDETLVRVGWPTRLRAQAQPPPIPATDTPAS
ncbi:MAG: VOC family protein [Terriglobia bacterium]